MCQKTNKQKTQINSLKHEEPVQKSSYSQIRRIFFFFFWCVLGFIPCKYQGFQNMKFGRSGWYFKILKTFPCFASGTVEIWVLSARLQEFSLFSQLTKALSGMTCSWRSPGSMWALLCGQSVALKWHVLWNVKVLQALPSPGSEESGPHLMLLVDSDISASVNSSYQRMMRPLGPTSRCV